MKFQNIRRVGVFAVLLCLALALMLLALAAPGQADDSSPGDLTPEPTPKVPHLYIFHDLPKSDPTNPDLRPKPFDGNTVQMKVGEKIDLITGWENEPQPAAGSSIGYEWKFAVNGVEVKNYSSAVFMNAKNGSVSVVAMETITEDDKVSIKCTATWADNGIEDTDASCDLVVGAANPSPTVSIHQFSGGFNAIENLSLTVGGSVDDLYAQCNAPDFGETTYVWTGSGDISVTEDLPEQPKVKAEKQGTGRIKVTAKWTPEVGVENPKTITWAEKEIEVNVYPGLGITSTIPSEAGKTPELKVGSSGELKTAWYSSAGDNPQTGTAPGDVKYTWTYDSNYVSVATSGSIGENATVTALQAASGTTVSVTATFNSGKTTATANYTLSIAGPTLKIGTSSGEITDDRLELNVGGTADLTANLSSVPGGTIRYEWKCDPDGAAIFEFKSGDTAQKNPTITALESGKITATAYWKPGGSQPEVPLASSQKVEINVAKPVLDVTVDPSDGKLKIGGSAKLTATLKNTALTTDVITYDWTVSKGANIISCSPGEITSTTPGEITANATVNANNTADKAEVTVTAKWKPASGNEVTLGTKTVAIEVVSSKLMIKVAEIDGVELATGGEIKSGELELNVGQTVKLEVEWDEDTKPAVSDWDKVTYAWKWSDPAGEHEGSGDTLTADATAGGEMSFTATATLEDGTKIESGAFTIEVVGPTLELSATRGDSPIGQNDIIVKKDVIWLKAQWKEGTKPQVDDKDITYEWTHSYKDGSPVEEDAVRRVNGDPVNGIPSVVITVGDEKVPKEKVYVTLTATEKATGTEDASEQKKVLATATWELNIYISIESISLPETANVELGQTITLTPSIKPEDATNKNVAWKSDNEDIARVDPKTGVVTGVKTGKAKITATVVDGGETFTASCEVSVVAPTVKGLTFSRDAIVRSKSDPVDWDLTVVLLPAGATLGGGSIEWTVKLEEGADPKGLAKTSEKDLTLTLKSNSPGKYTVMATYKSSKGDVGPFPISVEISGITLTRMSAKLLVGQNLAIALDGVYGFADDGTGTSNVEWNSSDPSIVSVMGGELTAWKLGKAVITATKNGYTAECEVEVTEDGEVIAGPYKATTGNPLVLGDGPVYQVYTDLNKISKNKTGERDDKGNPRGNGSPLSYITNVSVPTKQGTLYYNYDSDANTGDGVGITDRFALKADGAVRSLSLLYFVPKQGFKGTAEITFSGWAQDGTSFSGVIRVTVEGAEASISYRTQSGVPVYFLTDDFDAFCRSQTSRGVNYVTFDLPKANQGVLYYNYVGGEGIRVSASTRFSKAGRYTIGDVCFVPNAAFGDTVTIPFHGVDTAGMAFTGSVVINITSPGGDSTGVYLSGERGDLVTLQASLLNDICKETINDTLSFVTFRLPALEKGILYYNYRGAGDFDSRVNATTRYFFSGVPGISNITFVPATNATGQIAISYTGYGTSGASFDGTLYIDLGGVNPIYYFAAKNNSVTFDRNDFSSAGLHQNVSVSYVVFTGVSDTGLGTLYYNRTGSSKAEITPSASSAARYYVSPTSSQSGLSQVSFLAKDLTGNVTITYTAYDSNGKMLFDGSVVIQVGTLTPTDTDVSCTTGGRAWLSASALSRACSPALSEALSYVEITSVPDPAVGRLYLDYSGFGTGTAVQPGDRFYYSGSPNISQLCFVPHAGFTGEAEITYIGYGSDSQEQVSGRVMVDVTSSKTSVFSDMDGYRWAIDSVEFLRRSGTVKGVGNNNYSPGGSITRGDFILMLVRAYGFTASGGASYHDVPADSYYAEAIRIATALGIVQGYNGYFNPTSPLSRQDAMVMIFNSLKAGGMAITNGLTADFGAYYDGGQVASYAREAVGSLLRMSVVKGDGNGYLRPQGLLNRAEAAMLMHTIMTL